MVMGKIGNDDCRVIDVFICIHSIRREIHDMATQDIAYVVHVAKST